MSNVKDQISVKRHKVQEIELYELTRDDIDKISGKSSNADIFLNVAIGCISVSITLFVALFTTDVKPTILVIFISLICMLLLVFLVLILLWNRARQIEKNVRDKILNRVCANETSNP